MYIGSGKKENIAQAGRGSSAPTNGSVLSILSEHPFFLELPAEIRCSRWARIGQMSVLGEAENVTVKKVFEGKIVQGL